MASLWRTNKFQTVINKQIQNLINELDFKITFPVTASVENFTALANDAF